MSILLKCTYSIKRYIEEIHHFNEDVNCPQCQRKSRKHGHYKRNVIFKRVTYRIPVLRRRCPHCNITFSLLPFFVIPWNSFSNTLREFCGRLFFQRVPITHFPDYFSWNNAPVVSLRTLFRWKARFLTHWKSWKVNQRSRLAREYELGEGLLPLYRKGMNTEQERNLLLSASLADKLPRKGRLLSAMNLVLPPSGRW